MNRVGFILVLVMTLLILASAIKDKDTKSDEFNQISPELGLIRNASNMTLCAEDDNINVPLYFKNLSAFRITATHPTYLPTFVKDEGWNCSPHCKECYKPIPFFIIPSKIIYNDTNVIIKRENPPNWHTPSLLGMNVSIKDEVKREENVTYLVIYKLIEGTSSDYPQVFVLYVDGNVRIKPQAPCCLNDPSFGSSVIIGATDDQGPQYVEIGSVEIDPINLTMNIEYRDNTSAHIKMQVNRYENIVEVSNITYDTTNYSFARFRSMWVKDGNADVDHIWTDEGKFPIMGGWTDFNGTWWQFFRTFPSTHNTYAPDIKIEIVPNQK